jgi:spermidine/putrescine transport system permease protein
VMAKEITRRQKRLSMLAADSGFVTFVTLVMLFLYTPIIVLVVYSFNDNRTLTWPMKGFTLSWYEKLFQNEQILQAIANSFYVATCSTFLTLLIGIPAAMALHRYHFPGKTIFRRLLLLPIALPGIVTGISMLNMFKMFGFNLNLQTVIIGHATALLAVVVTQIFARLQRLPKSLEEASADLGAGPLKTFLFITLPNIKSAIFGAGLLSFVLSFDEIPVTFFLTGRDNTLPMYIYSTMRRGVTPEINAVGSIIVLMSLILIIASVLITIRDRTWLKH